MSETQKITALFFLLPSEFNDAKSYEILLICQTKCVNLQALKYFVMEKEEKYKLLKQQIEALVAGEDDAVSVMVVSVVLRGSVQKPLWFLMWSSSRVI